MKVTYYVNAMMLIEGAQSRVLCDPWISFDNESESGLYNFPAPRTSRADIAAIRPDFIYITHTHADHLDPATLALFDRDTPILVSWYEDNFTERAVRRLGFRDVRVADRMAGLTLNGDDTAWLEPSAVYPDVDSIGVFRIDGRVLVNANDNPFHDGQCRSIRERFGPIEVAAVPIGLQGPYPMFYDNLTPAEKVCKAEEKKQKSYQSIVGYVTTLEPRFLFCFAAGAIYGGPKARMLRYAGIGRADEAIRIAQAARPVKPVLLSQGCSYDFDTDTQIGTYRPADADSEADYVEAIAGLPSKFDENGTFHIAPDERIDLTKLLRAARAKQRLWQERRGVGSDMTYFLDVGEPRLYRLSMRDDDVYRTARPEREDEPFEIFRLPYSLLVGLLTEHYNWSNVKTQFVDFYRQPDVFDPELHILMSHLHI